jgi:hypothetical protein
VAKNPQCSGCRRGDPIGTYPVLINGHLTSWACKACIKNLQELGGQIEIIKDKK